MKDLFEKVEQAVKEAEAKYGSGAGVEKRAFAVSVINSLVNIPILPEWVEAKVFGLLVDFLVHLYNKKLGEEWGEIEL